MEFLELIYSGHPTSSESDLSKDPAKSKPEAESDLSKDPTESKPEPESESESTPKSKIKEFISDFRTGCAAPNASDHIAASFFYSKSKFICDPNNINLVRIHFQELLCESCLLFEQDFDYLSSRSFDGFLQNRSCFQHVLPENASKLHLAFEETNSIYYLEQEHPAIYAVLQEQVQIARMEHSNRQQLYCNPTSLSEPDKTFYTLEVWPEFMERYRRLLYVDKYSKRYTREITIKHTSAYDQYAANCTVFEKTMENYRHWLLSSSSTEHRHRPDEQKCAELIDSLNLSDSRRTQILNRMESKMEDFSSLYQMICSNLGLSRNRTYSAHLQKIKLLCQMTPALSPSQDEVYLVCHLLWNRICGTKSIPPRKFFRLLQKNFDLNQLRDFPPLHYGLLIYNLLDSCFPDMQESLIHKNIHIMQHAIVGKYKELYPNDYTNYVDEIAKNKDRISKYDALWSDPSILSAERLNYLKKHVHRIPLAIPDNGPLWEGIPKIQASSDNHAYRKKNFQDALALLLFENALQDCIREKAKETLWNVVWTKTSRKT